MPNNPAPGRIFVFGLGYSALRLANELSEAGWPVSGTCRSPEKAAELMGRGIDAAVFDRDRPLADCATVLSQTTHVLISAPPDEAGDPVFDRHGSDIATLKAVQWVGYLSTTGVYGDTGGAWVDEGSPTEPTAERSKRRLAAENAWRGLWRDHGVPVHVFRLAGIYGPGRSTLDQVKTGSARRIVKPGHVFSRIHVDDIVSALRGSMAAPDPGAVYNLSDDEPASSADVVAHACALLGIPVPPEIPFDTADLSPMARSFYAECRRVRNDRLKRDLGVSPRYPTYREGLAAIFEGDEGDG